MRTRRLPPIPALFLFRILVVFHLLGMPAAISFLVPDLVHADEGDTGISGRAVSGRVLSATDAKPLAGIVLTLTGQISTTDATGRFTFKQPPSGYQLIKIHHASLDAYRKPLNGTPGGLLHADPVLVNVSPDNAIELPDPIWVVQTHAVSYPLTPGHKTDIKPAHLPGVTVAIPEGTTIKGEDGLPNTSMSITAVPPDRVPRLPDSAAPRTVYLMSFEKHGGGVSNKPVPVIMPNETGADPGTRLEFWYYDKSPDPDPASHQWKRAGSGTVSPDGRSVIPETGVGMPRFCYAYSTDVNSTNTQTCPPDAECKQADPVDVTSGVFSMEKTDMVLPGVLPVHITRTYRSKSEGIGPFGQGGSFNYHLYLSVVGSALRLQLPDQSRYLFSPDPDGKYRNTAYPFLKGAAITRLGSTDELRWRDGMVYVFNSSGWLIAQRDRYNNTIQIIRDGVTPRIVEIREPSGRTLTFTYTTVKRGFALFDVIASITDPLGRTVRYTYYVGSNGRLSRVTDPAGGVTTYTYGEYAQSYYWNEGMLSITDARGIPYLQNQYDTNGRVKKQILADGGTYTFAYTLAGQTVTQTNVTDPRGNTTIYRVNAGQYITEVERPGPNLTTYEREVGTNKLTAVVDPLSRRTEFTYDSNGNVLTIKDPESNTTTFTYESTYNRLATITDALTPANVTTFTYNDTARTTTITDPETKQTVIQYSTTGQPTSITDPLSHATSFAYDSQGNPITTTDALSNATTRSYDAVSRLILLIDPRGKQTRFSYDDLNRVTQIQDALGGLTSFGYDTNGNLLTVTDAKNQTTTYTYDEMDRLKIRTDALSRTESYQYDLNGNLSKFIDRKSQQATFSYDTLNRRTGATYPDATVTFGYDAIGRLTSVSDSVGGNITWTYDTVGSGHHPRVQETTTPGTVMVEYDEIGRRLKLSATGQTDVTYTYDKNSRLKTVTQGTQIVTLAYDDAGRRTSLTYPNGVVTGYGYDNANRLLSIDHIKTPTTIEALTYQNDAAGNRIKLTRANAAASLIPQAVTNTAFDATNQQTRFNSASTNLAYDNNGNLTSFTDASGTTTYTWNARNQLTAISGPSLSASFVYDGLGRRSSKTINSTTTGFWYDGDDVLAELSGSTLTATYIRSLSIDEPFGILRQDGTYFYIYDGIGSTLALTDQTITPPVQYTYEPFGKTQSTNPTFSNSFQFTGRENDSNGLYFYRARYYSPALHRFVSEDPLEFAAGDTNLHAYVLDNPANYTDPTGEIVPLLLMCARGGLTSVGFDVLAGRKVDWIAAGIDCLTGRIRTSKECRQTCRKRSEAFVITKSESEDHSGRS